MNRARLILLACPALLTSTLLVAPPVNAAEVVAQPKKTVESKPAKPIYEVVFEQETAASTTELTNKQANTAIDPSECACSGEDPLLESTDEELDAAIARYGCDCSGCLTAVRQLQGKLPLLGG